MINWLGTWLSLWRWNLACRFSGACRTYALGTITESDLSTVSPQTVCPQCPMTKRTRSLTVKNWVISLTNTTENHYHHSQIFPVCACQSGAWSGGSAAAVSRCSCPPIRRSAGSSPQSGSAPIYLLHLCWWSSNCTYKKYTNREKWNILNNVCFKKSMVPTSKFSSLTFHLIFCCCWWGVGKRGGRREGQR